MTFYHNFNLHKFTFTLQQQNSQCSHVSYAGVVFSCANETGAVFRVAQLQTFMFGECVMPLSIWLYRFDLISFSFTLLPYWVYLMNSLISPLMSCISLNFSLFLSAYVCVSVISIPFVIQHHSQWFIVSSDYVTEIDLMMKHLYQCRSFRLDSENYITLLLLSRLYAQKNWISYLKWGVLR